MGLGKSLGAEGAAIRWIRLALAACALWPGQGSAALLPSPDGATVYDTVNNVSWLADTDFAATNRFGLPLCGNSTPQPCVNANGSMSYTSATAWISAMNAANYLGHNNWQLPTTPLTDAGCQFVGANGGSFGFNCTASAFGSLYYNALGLKAPNTAVPIPSNTVGPFSNFQPYLYWSQTNAGTNLGYITFSFNTGWEGANTTPHNMYVLPMIPGKIPGTPPASGQGLQVNPGGLSVYDPVTNVTWAANANLAAANAFGLPPCSGPGSPKICVAQDGSMNFDSANQFITNMNDYNVTGYLGQNNWQLPPIDPSCSGYNCDLQGSPMGELFYDQLNFSKGMSVVAAPNIAVGPFQNIQPYLYWTCQAASIDASCQTTGPVSNMAWSFSFGNGFEGTDVFANDLYVTAYFAGSPGGSCTYSYSSGGQLFSAQGGMGSITITTGAGCPWTVGGLPSWVTATSATAGLGSATVTFQILPNSGGDLSGSFTIAGTTFTVEQQAPSIPGLSFLGSMPHLAAENGWNTTFTLVNKSAAPLEVRSSFFDDNGIPLTLPLTLPQQPPAAGPLVGASLDQTLAANASFILEASGPASAPLAQGSAQIAATGGADGFAIFHFDPSGQEAVVPLVLTNAPSYLLAFDNTNSVVTGVAIENISMLNVNVPVVLRDDTGTVIANKSISLNGRGHMSFVLSTQFPQTANIRGTVEFDTPGYGTGQAEQISVMGIRYTPPGTLTTIPALANVGTTGGSVAHLASGGGWETTFVLVNTGTTAAQARLNFFNDSGRPLPLPLSSPQASGPLSTVAPFVVQSVAAGASLWLQSAGTGALQEGSAQLTTTGNISGFVIFRYNPNGQEAVVPIESRNASSYLLAFDNTNGTATGVAVSAVSVQDATVSVMIRDDTGTPVVTGPITLAPNGHYSQGLTTLFPQTAGIRGTVEFDAPSVAQISVVGIRSPPTLTFTTLPPLAK